MVDAGPEPMYDEKMRVPPPPPQGLVGAVRTELYLRYVRINIDMNAIKVSMVRGYHNHTLQTGPSHCTVRKSRRTFTLTRH